MSWVRHEITAYCCDGDCSPATEGWVEDWSIAGLKTMLRREGWTITRAAWLCPECASVTAAKAPQP